MTGGFLSGIIFIKALFTTVYSLGGAILLP
jgi:hypothetical protein